MITALTIIFNEPRHHGHGKPSVLTLSNDKFVDQFAHDTWRSLIEIVVAVCFILKTNSVNKPLFTE